MLSSELEFCLNQAFHQARTARHEFLTVEHLLLAILDAPKVREVLEGCGADIERLTTDLKQHVENNTPRLSPSEERASVSARMPPHQPVPITATSTCCTPVSPVFPH